MQHIYRNGCRWKGFQGQHFYRKVADGKASKRDVFTEMVADGRTSKRDIFTEKSQMEKLPSATYLQKGPKVGLGVP